MGEKKQLLVEQVRVVHGVVCPIHQQQLAVDPEHRGLRHITAEDLDRVASVDRQRRAVLRPNHDRLGLPLPEVLEVVTDVVQPRRTRVSIAEPDRVRQPLGDVDDPRLGEDHRRADVMDVTAAQGYLDHSRILVG